MTSRALIGQGFAAVVTELLEPIGETFSVTICSTTRGSDDSSPVVVSGYIIYKNSGEIQREGGGARATHSNTRCDHLRCLRYIGESVWWQAGTAGATLSVRGWQCEYLLSTAVYATELSAHRSAG